MFEIFCLFNFFCLFDMFVCCSVSYLSYVTSTTHRVDIILFILPIWWICPMHIIAWTVPIGMSEHCGMWDVGWECQIRIDCRGVSVWNVLNEFWIWLCIVFCLFIYFYYYFLIISLLIPIHSYLFFRLDSTSSLTTHSITKPIKRRVFSGLLWRIMSIHHKHGGCVCGTCSIKWCMQWICAIWCNGVVVSG